MSRVLLIGRWQPLHSGHKALIDFVLEQGHKVIVGIRDTPISKENPFSIEERIVMIRAAFGDRLDICTVPDFDVIAYGRQVGYSFWKIDLPPDVEAVSGTREREILRSQRGFVVWFTGLPGAGKTTIARLVQQELARRGLRAECLDGDIIRQGLSRDLGFTKEDRDTNIERVTFLVKLLTRNGLAVLCSFISPYREQRAKARAEIGNFVECYVECPLEVCIQRDVKELYQQARAGKIKNFTGISDPYEQPEDPEIICHTAYETPEQSAAKVVSFLDAQGYLGGYH